MLARAAAILILCGLAVLLPGRPTRSRRPREHFQNAEVIYDWVSNSRGDKLRTFISRPRNASGKVPVLFVVGWLSCDSVESPQGETDGSSALVLRLIDQSGYATVRTEEPGVGERLYRGEEVSSRSCHHDFELGQGAIGNRQMSGALQPGPRSLLGIRGLAGFE